MNLHIISIIHTHFKSMILYGMNFRIISSVPKTLIFSGYLILVYNLLWNSHVIHYIITARIISDSDSEHRQLRFASSNNSIRPQPNSLEFPVIGLLDVGMLSSSLRRVAWAPTVPMPGISRTSGQALAATSNVRQRRYSSSSSKPSDGSRKVDTSSQTPAKTSRRSRRDGNGRNGSSKPNQNPAFSNLPSVPSTQHRQPHGMYIYAGKTCSLVLGKLSLT